MYVCNEVRICDCCVGVWFSVPLVQCQQKFSSMDIQYRNTVKQLIKDSAHKFQLDDIAFSSFVSRFGYRTAVSPV